MPYFLGIRALRGTNPAIGYRALKSRRHQFGQQGFTLIELVVTTAIIALITGLILVSDSAFGGKILLENLAYDMALSIRQAQVYGISVQRFGASTFGAGYGVHYDVSSPYTYITFADACVSNGLYDAPSVGCPNGELVQSTSIDRGFYVAKLCVPAQASVAACTSAGNPGVSTLDILFIRPQPDAMISGNGQSCTQGLGTCYDSARIVLMSPRGDVTSVLMQANGQVSVAKQ